MANFLLGGGPQAMGQVPTTPQPYWMQGNPLSMAAKKIFGNTDLALALLANSGYSPQKRSLGEIVGTSALQAQGMGQARQQQETENQIAQARLQAAQNPVRKPLAVIGADGKPTYVDEQDAIGMAPYALGSADMPSNIREYEYYKSLSPEDQKQYLSIQRQPTVPQVVMIGNVPHLVDRITGQLTPLSTLANEATGAGTVKAAEAQGAAVGGGAGSVIADIQKKGANAQTINAVLDIADPLIDTATGSSVGAGADKVAAFFGKSLDGAEAIAQLQVLQAGLMLNQPRMEGPQSDHDVELYRQAAASLGDPNIPRATKKAALQTIRMMQQKYMERAQSVAPSNSDGWTEVNGVRIREKR